MKGGGTEQVQNGTGARTNVGRGTMVEAGICTGTMMGTEQGQYKDMVKYRCRKSDRSRDRDNDMYRGSDGAEQR